MPIKLGSLSIVPKGVCSAYVGRNAVFLGVPSGYKKLIGLTFNSATWYRLTGVHLNGSDTVRISFSAKKACNVFGSYTSSSAQTNYSLYVSTSSGSKYLRYNGDTYPSYLSSSNLNKRLDVVITPTGSHGLPQTESWEAKSFEGEADLCIGLTGPEVTSAKFSGNIYGDIIVDGRLKLIPCERLSDNELGYWEAYSGVFYEPIGSSPDSLGYA